MVKANKATPPKWSGDFLSKMHLNKITINMLADKIHCRREYVSRLFNGNETASPTKVAEIETAINELIAEKEG